VKPNECAKFLLLLTGLTLSSLSSASDKTNQLILIENLPPEQRERVYAQILNYLKSHPQQVIPNDSTIAVDQEGRAYVVTKDGAYVFPGMPSTVMWR
jgi:hypothetical protein